MDGLDPLGRSEPSGGGPTGDRRRREGAPAIAVEGLVHRFGDRTAVSGIDFAVEAGEIAALLGPNGGGKTTLFRILATLLPPTSGTALLCGHDVRREPEAVRSLIGVVFQRPALDPKLTVAENLAHHGRLNGLRGSALGRRAGEAMEALGIAERARERVEVLSGGQQRRVELAKVLLARPRVLLLDEPSTGLDPNARRDLFAQLDRLRREAGATVLLTTHVMEEAERCDRVGILDRGSLLAFEEPPRLKARVGGDVIVLRGRDPHALAARLRERFGATPHVVDATVRLESQRGHHLLEEVVEAFRDEITAASWGQPTLEDVFVRLTGHAFREPAA